MKKLLINDIIRAISFGVFGFICADNGLIISTLAFWALIACMVIHEIIDQNTDWEDIRDKYSIDCKGE